MAAMFQEFKDPQLVRELQEAAFAYAPDKPVTLMEVCGGHTTAIGRFGIRSLMPENVTLASGPGCPVCVTSNKDIDSIIALTRLPNVVLCVFGDMMRVPGSSTSLQQQKASGASVEVVYSPLDALALAKKEPAKHIVFAGVGFETTTPLIAATIMRARNEGLDNFSVFSSHKNMPGALRAIVADPSVALDALILPGHVSTIIGSAPYEFLARDYHIPGVITGFEPVDIMQGIVMILRQLKEGRAGIENAYLRGVMSDGNPVALTCIDTVFETTTAQWRGLGPIEGSGYRIREEFAHFDAAKRFEIEIEPTKEPHGCRCGDILRGALSPLECPLFGGACNPAHPVGPCMVSSEGSCAAAFRYGR